MIQHTESQVSTIFSGDPFIYLFHELRQQLLMVDLRKYLNKIRDCLTDSIPFQFCSRQLKDESTSFLRN